MKLSDLVPASGATHRPKRVGRGRSSGHGKTSGRGQKGQRARSGSGIKPWMEGGQMPLVKRIPKRGFTHVSPEVEIVNVGHLERFAAGTVVDPALLAAHGLIEDAGRVVKILGGGALTHPLVVKAHEFSQRAAAHIAQTGGEVHRLPCAP